MIPLRRLFVISLLLAFSLLALSCAHAPKSSRAPLPPKPPESREFDTRTPFVLSGGLDDLAPRGLEQVRVFRGAAEFRRFADSARLNVWPIGRFAADARPRDAAAFELVLRAHAAEIGADYIVVLTEPMEIQQAFHLQFDHLHYGAVAYRRVVARIGVNFTPAGAGPQVLAVAGFVPGSRAETDGLRVGDVIETIDGTEAKPDNEAYWKKAVHWVPGQTVRVQLLRAGQELALDVTLTAVE